GCPQQRSLFCRAAASVRREGAEDFLARLSPSAATTLAADGATSPVLAVFMQDYGLTVDKFLDHAARWFGDKTVIGAGQGSAVSRTGYAPIRERSNRMSGALRSLGLE